MERLGLHCFMQHIAKKALKTACTVAAFKHIWVSVEEIEYTIWERVRFEVTGTLPDSTGY